MRSRVPRAQACCLALLLTAVTVNVHAHEAGHARYLGNEGVLVAHGETKVLFDAFYADSYGQYVLVSEATKSAMLAGEPPFDSVDAIFVSHVHGDHFTAQPALEYLRANEAVVLYGSSQIRDALAAVTGEDDPALERVRVVSVARGEPATRIEIGDLAIAAVNIPHAGWPERAEIINLAFRVSLDDAVTVMHLGDADPAPVHFEPHEAYFAERTLHAVFPPYWFYGTESGRAILSDQLGAEASIGIHVPSQAIGNGPAWRQRFDGDLFTDPGETRELIH